MDERKNKMTDERYREILPVAYMTAAIVKGRQPRPVEVGLCARAIVDAEDENNLAYRVAMATKIHCTIVGVKRVPTKANSDKYEITYRTLGRDEDEMIPSPLLNGFPLGKVVCDMCVDELHSDIVGYFDFFDGVDIRVIEDDGIFVDVDFGRSSIVVENGRWYVSNFD